MPASGFGNGRFLDWWVPRYDPRMSNYVFSNAVRSSIRSELRYYALRTSAVYVDLSDEEADDEIVVARAGELVHVPTDEQSSQLQSCISGVRRDLWLSAWIPAARSIDFARSELEACASRLEAIADRAWLERRIWRALAASWRCDDVGPRSDVQFSELRLVPWHRLTGLSPLVVETSL